MKNIAFLAAIALCAIPAQALAQGRVDTTKPHATIKIPPADLAKPAPKPKLKAAPGLATEAAGPAAPARSLKG
jgi:hypothetical protein